MKIIFTTFVSCIILFTNHPIASANQYDDTLKLLEVTGSLDIGAQFGSAMASQMISAIKNARKDIPQRAFEIIEEETINTIRSEMIKPEGLVDELIKIYSKYYTHQEIKDLLEFYETDLGKKIIVTMPNVVQESMMAGQQWAQKIAPQVGERIDRRLKEEGIEIKY